MSNAVEPCKIPTNGKFANEAMEIRRRDSIIYTSAKDMVWHAIRIGEIMIEVRKQLHDEFFDWCNKEFNFSKTTIYRYIGAFNYQKQIEKTNNLTEAYKMIETLDAQKKQSENQKAQQRVKDYNKTGIKPEGWRRGTDDKLAKEEADRDARIEAVKRDALERENKAKETREKAERERAEQTRQKERLSKDTEKILNIIDESSKKYIERANFKEKIRLSQGGKNDPVLDMLIDHIESLEGNSRKIEFCYNTIKVLKRIANELQEVTE